MKSTDADRRTISIRSEFKKKQTSISCSRNVFGDSVVEEGHVLGVQVEN